MIDAAGLAGIAPAALMSRAGVRAGKIAATVRLRSKLAGVVSAGDRLVARAHLAEPGERLIALVGASHKAQPLSDGLPREEAREQIFARAAPSVFEHVLDELKARKALVAPERLALPTHKATVAGADDRITDARSSMRLPAGRTEAARCGGARGRRVKAPAAVVEKVAALLLREKLLTRLDTLVFHAEALQQLKAEVSALKGSAPGGRATVDVAAFKDRYGISRKYAIPLLEFLDRERVTRRTGDVRLVL